MWIKIYNVRNQWLHSYHIRILLSKILRTNARSSWCKFIQSIMTETDHFILIIQYTIFHSSSKNFVFCFKIPRANAKSNWYIHFIHPNRYSLLIVNTMNDVNQNSKPMTPFLSLQYIKWEQTQRSFSLKWHEPLTLSRQQRSFNLSLFLEELCLLLQRSGSKCKK